MSFEFTTDRELVGPWVAEKVGGTYTPIGSEAIGMLKEGELVCGVLYEDFNGSSVKAHIAGTGKRWLTREFLKVMFDYPFNQLKVKKLIGLVDETNLAARRFDEHLGFVLEAVIKDAAPHGDMLILTMTKEQCRFI